MMKRALVLVVLTALLLPSGAAAKHDRGFELKISICTGHHGWCFCWGDCCCLGLLTCLLCCDGFDCLEEGLEEAGEALEEASEDIEEAFEDLADNLEDAFDCF